MAVIPLIFRTLIWLLLLVSPGVLAETPLVLLSDANTSYARMFAALQRHYTGALEARVLPNTIPPQTEPRLLLAIGSRACATALDLVDPRGRLFCLFLPAQTFNELTANPKGQALLADHRLSALYLDQPLARQMHLAQLIAPNLKRIGTVVGPNSDARAQAFEQQARALGLEPVVGRLDSSDNPIEVLSPVIEDSDLFLSLPDPTIFNRAAAKWILYITLRKGVPLLGFSARYADAGAVIALYSDTNSLARQAASMLEQASDRLPLPSWPQEFSITINHTAARNLGLNLPSADQLTRRLYAQEGP